MSFGINFGSFGCDLSTLGQSGFPGGALGVFRGSKEALRGIRTISIPGGGGGPPGGGGGFPERGPDKNNNKREFGGPNNEKGN